MRTLVDSGAQALLIVNSPDIGMLPETHLIAELTGDRRLVRQTSRLTRDFNKQLARRMRGIERDLDIDLVEFDLFSFSQFAMVNNEALRFTNTTDACFSSINIHLSYGLPGRRSLRQLLFFRRDTPDGQDARTRRQSLVFCCPGTCRGKFLNG